MSAAIAGLPSASAPNAAPAKASSRDRRLRFTVRLVLARPMLSPPAITADSNACRHPTIEVINPVAPIGFPCGAPRSAPDPGPFRPFTLQSLLQVIRNSKKAASRYGWMAPLRDMAATLAPGRGCSSYRLDSSPTGCSETSLTHRGDGSNSGGQPAPKRLTRPGGQPGGSVQHGGG